MNCRILLFAQLAEAIGQRELSLEVPEVCTAADAISLLGDEHPAIAQLDGRLAIAINEQYASLNTRLNDGDDLALIPPVSGG